MIESEKYRLFRIIPPQQNSTGIKALAHMLESVLGSEPICFDILLEAGGRRRLFLRLPEQVPAARCLSYLRGAHPQVSCEEVDTGGTLEPELDPAYPTEDQEIAQAELSQENHPCCPLRMETDDDDFASADPILPFLHAADDLREGEKILLQVAARLPKRDRSAPYRALAAGEMGRGAREALASSIPARLFLGLGFALIFGLAGVLLLKDGSRAKGLMALALAIGASAASYWLFKASRWVLEVDPHLIAAKLRHRGCDAQVRVTAYGPRAEERLATALAAYCQLGAGATNSLVPRAAYFDPRLPVLQAQGRFLRGGFCWLNSAELALLWHFPQGEAEVGGLERTPFPTLLPSGDQSFLCNEGFAAGFTDHPEARREVRLPREILDEHIAVLGASGMGKSNLLRLIGSWIMESGGQLIAIDPHEELADYLAGVVPASQRDKTVYLCASNRPHPFGLNLVSVAPDLAADYADLVAYQGQEGVDRAINSVLSTMERARAEAWGQRMRSLAASGTKLMAEVGRATGFDYTLLDLETLLDDLNFVRDLISIYRRVGEDPMVVGYWYSGWMRATESQRREWAYSTVNRINLLKSGVMGNIVGSRKTTLDIDRILREGHHLIVNAATGWEENTRVLMGMILDLVNLALRRLPKSAQPRIYVMLDEFQLINAANLQGLVNELRKWGVRFVVGTQGLSNLEDPSVSRVVLNNVQQVFAFSAGPEEQKNMAALLGGAVEPEALARLSSYHFYARLRIKGQVQPVFSFEVGQAPEADETVRREILVRSQKDWCRPLEVVARERRIVAEKYTLARYDRAAYSGLSVRDEAFVATSGWPGTDPGSASIMPQPLQQTKPSRKERAKARAGARTDREKAESDPSTGLLGDTAWQPPLFEEV